MSDTPKRLRDASRALDGARTDIDYGELDAPNEEYRAILESVDDVIHDMAETLREIATNVEVQEETDE